jgi:hypothetical protein
MVFLFLQNSIGTSGYISRYGIVSFQQSLHLEFFSAAALSLKMFSPDDSRIENISGQHYLYFYDKNVS